MLRLIACSFALAIAAACAFHDPNAPPPPDPCLSGGSRGAAELWARVDGPASCLDPTHADTISHFTGRGWTADSAYCRARDLFLGAAEVKNAPQPDGMAISAVPVLAIHEDLLVPSNAFGYCIVNKGTASELVSYSVCGLPEAGKYACEETLVERAPMEITAEWVPCPGGARCATSEGDVCAGFGEADPNHTFALYLDVPFYGCSALEGDAGPVLEDQHDSLFLSLGANFGRQSALCMASSALSADGNLQYGVEKPERNAAAPRDERGERIGPPAFTDLAPTGARGYCLYGDTTSPYEFVIYNLCDSLAVADDPDTDADERAGYAPQEVCEQGLPFITHARRGSWVACPGGALCAPAE